MRFHQLFLMSSHTPITTGTECSSKVSLTAHDPRQHWESLLSLNAPVTMVESVSKLRGEDC